MTPQKAVKRIQDNMTRQQNMVITTLEHKTGLTFKELVKYLDVEMAPDKTSIIYYKGDIISKTMVMFDEVKKDVSIRTDLFGILKD